MAEVTGVALPSSSDAVRDLTTCSIEAPFYAERPKPSLSAEEVEAFQRDGFLILRGWVCESDQLTLRAAWDKLLGMCESCSNPRNEFSVMGEKVQFFVEAAAKNADGTRNRPLDKAVYRLGHSLHLSAPETRGVVFNERAAGVCASLGIEKVVVPQSMFINKPAEIGLELGPHVDSAFIYTEPFDSAAVLGFWTPLEPSTVKTGCLYAVPGSHKLPVTRIFKRGLLLEEKKYEWVPPEEIPMDISGAVPLEMAPGDMLLIHGGLVHYSTANTSDSSRLAFTWHLVDCGGGRRWAPRAWLQREDGGSFPCLY